MKLIIFTLCLCFTVAGCATPSSYVRRHLTAEERRRILDVAPTLSEAVLYERIEIPNLSKEAVDIFQRELVVRRRPGWTDNIKTLVRQGKIVIGMTKDQVLVSLGKPYDINRTVTQYGVHEQLVYGYGDSKYVYLDDGVVTSWQD